MKNNNSACALFFTLLLGLPFGALDDCLNSDSRTLEKIMGSGIVDVVLLAERGNRDTQFVLGLLYDSETIQAPFYAVPWYIKAAAQGDRRALLYLAEKYFLGHGVLQNRIKAHALANIASAKGENSAYFVRDRASDAMTTSQIAKAEALAQHCLNEEYDDCL
jgi:TPR repeat protein